MHPHWEAAQVAVSLSGAYAGTGLPAKRYPPTLYPSLTPKP